MLNNSIFRPQESRRRFGIRRGGVHRPPRAFQPGLISRIPISGPGTCETRNSFEPNRENLRRLPPTADKLCQEFPDAHLLLLLERRKALANRESDQIRKVVDAELVHHPGAVGLHRFG